MAIIRRATAADVAAVMARPSAVTALEFPDGIPAEDLQTDHVDALLIPHPVVVSGNYPIGPGLRGFWFASTDEGLRQVRVFKTYVAAMKSRHGCRFRCRTRSPHPDCARWFSLIGFRQTASQTYEA